MKVLDNLELVKPLLVFDDEQDFYLLQIIKRKKDNPGFNKDNVVIKSYYIKSIEQLEKLYEEIKTICISFNARACITLNKKRFDKVSLKMLSLMAQYLTDGNYKASISAFDSACGLTNNAEEKRWIIDLDEEHIIWTPQIKYAIWNSSPEGNKIISSIPSKSGYHLITKPFNTEEFKNILSDELASISTCIDISIDIHKNNPTNLFCVL